MVYVKSPPEEQKPSPTNSYHKAKKKRAIRNVTLKKADQLYIVLYKKTLETQQKSVNANHKTKDKYQTARNVLPGKGG